MMADEAKDAIMDDEGDSDVDMGAESGSDAGIPRTTSQKGKGKGKGKGKAKGAAQGSSTRNKLPYWKRVNKRATDLYSLSLSAVAAYVARVAGYLLLQHCANTASDVLCAPDRRRQC